MGGVQQVVCSSYLVNDKSIVADLYAPLTMRIYRFHHFGRQFQCVHFDSPNGGQDIIAHVKCTPLCDLPISIKVDKYYFIRCYNLVKICTVKFCDVPSL